MIDGAGGDKEKSPSEHEQDDGVGTEGPAEGPETVEQTAEASLRPTRKQHATWRQSALHAPL